jgi:hypothetical protein
MIYRARREPSFRIRQPNSVRLVYEDANGVCKDASLLRRHGKWIERGGSVHPASICNRCRHTRRRGVISGSIACLGDHPKAAIERRLKADLTQGEVSLCGHELRTTRTGHRIGPAGLVVAAHRTGDWSAPGNGGRLSSQRGNCPAAPGGWGRHSPSRAAIERTSESLGVVCPNHAA